MQIAVKTLCFAALCGAGVMTLIAPFALAGLVLVFGEYGLAVVLFGFGVLQAIVAALLVFRTPKRAFPHRPRKRRRTLSSTPQLAR